jgi:putative transcriptional regulator
VSERVDKPPLPRSMASMRKSGLRLSGLMKSGDSGYLDGQMLVAMPGMTDDRFQKTVIYLCAHSAEGAMGIVINRKAADLSFPDMLVQLGIIAEGEAIRLPRSVEGMQVLLGGPVETSRGFVLHSPDFFLDESTLPIDDDVCLTATVDILRAIASGTGPCNAVLALGYAGWSPGQLESEIQANGWLNCPADASMVFGGGLDRIYDLALRKIGIDLAMLSSEAGHA